jgi:hypothetical protein
MYISKSCVRNELDVTCIESVAKELQIGLDAFDAGNSQITTRYLRRWIVGYATEKAYQSSRGTEEAAVELRFWPGVHIQLEQRFDRRIHADGPCITSNWYSHQLQSSTSYQDIGGVDRLTLVLNQALLTILNTARLSCDAEVFNSLRLIIGWEHYTVSGFDYSLPKLLIPTNDFKQNTLAENITWARVVYKLFQAFRNDSLAQVVVAAAREIKNNKINQDALHLQSIAYRNGGMSGYLVTTKSENANKTEPEDGLEINRGVLFPERTRKFFL